MSHPQDGAPEETGLLLTEMYHLPETHKILSTFPNLALSGFLLIVTHRHYLGTQGETGLAGPFEVTQWGARSIEEQALRCNVSASTTWHPCYLPPS